MLSNSAIVCAIRPMLQPVLRAAACIALLVSCVQVALAQPASLSTVGGGYVQAAGSADFVRPQFTVSAWLRPTGPGENGGGTIVSCGQRPGTGQYLTSWWTGWDAASGSVLGMVVHQFNVTGTVITSHAHIGLNQWAHAALTFDGTTLRMYINGVFDSQLAYGFSGIDYPAAPAVNIGVFQIGSLYSYNHFQGQLDDVSIWGRALSDSEVAALASCEPMAGANGLLMHIPFTDDSLADTSGGGHDATPQGVVAFGPQATGLGGASIVGQPANASVCSGAASFSVISEGAGPFTYQWQIETAPGVWQGLANDPAPLPCGGGAFAYAAPVNSPTVNIGVHPCPGVMHYQIRCVVSSVCGSVTSNEATLLINSADFNNDGDTGTDQDIEAFFACLAGNCCAACGTADFNGDGDTGTDADIESFFRVLAGGPC